MTNTNYLAIDFGEKNIGLAYKTNGNPIVPIDIIKNISNQETIIKIIHFCQEKNINQIVIGLPLTLKGKIGHQADKTFQFIHLLEKHTDISIDTIDERYSSKTLIDIPNQDSYSAALLLELYLAKKSSSKK